MRNNKFKLSDMIPNAWFYKLKHMTKTTTRNNNNNNNNNKTKNYINHHHNHNQTLMKKLTLSPIVTTTAKPRPPIAGDPPRRSSSCRRRKPVFKPRSRLFLSNSSSSESDRSLDFDDDDQLLRLSSSTADIIIDLEAHDGVALRTNRIRGGQLSDGGGVDLPPILTRPIVNFDHTVFEAARNSRPSRAKTTATKTTTKKTLSVKIVREEKTLSRIKTSRSQNDGSLGRRPGIRLRANSPRLACARKSVSHRQCLSESFAVVKSSVDPQRDFRDSMVEMIVENNIRASKDLEELLACYLSLNSKQYHDVIVKAFEQIWFDMPHIRL